jgi:TRAP transporter TAXI family solute receptor
MHDARCDFLTKGGLKMKWTLFMIGIFGLMTNFAPPSGHAATELIPFYTPPAGGTAYVLGAGIISVTNKHVADVKIVHEAASGTMDIVRRMMQRESMKKDCFGVFGTVDGWNAYNGKNEYAGKPFTNLRMVVFVNATDLYFVVPANSSIKSYGDVKGKRIGMGGPGSTPANTALFLFEQFGVTKNDFKPYYYTYKETVEGIQDGSLDGGFVAGGFPIAAYSELSTTHNVRIVPVDEAVLNKVTSEHPYYYRTAVKAKSYKGIERDTPIMGFTTAVFTHNGVSSDFIYKFLKNLFDHRADYYSIHSSAKDMTPETALKGASVPIHPGAEKYLKEIGVKK